MFIFAGVFLITLSTFLYVYITRSRSIELSRDLDFKFSYQSMSSDDESDNESGNELANEYNFNDTHYLTRATILNFFHQDKNFKRLSTLYDNTEILASVKHKINNDKMISQDYEDTKNMYGDEFFSIKPSITYDISINDRLFNTSFAQLNVFKWFILNDYFLYIE